MKSKEKTIINSKSAKSFLEILNNKGKRDKTNPVRKNGFVVIVRNTLQLGKLQDHCFSQSYNDCLTVRYRLEYAPVFGTMIAAFISDLKEIDMIGFNKIKYMTKMAKKSGELHGDYQPLPDEKNWKTFCDKQFYEAFYQLLFSKQPREKIITPDLLARFMQVISNGSYLPVGRRLIFFGEINKEYGFKQELETLLTTHLKNLPERVGFVFSGVPDTVKLPQNDPHFLEIEWEDTSDKHTFLVSSLVDDRPAKKDLLDVGQYAVAIARLILHKQTHPLTIGIQARWGKGKSSFMQFIDTELMMWAPINKDLVTEYREIEMQRAYIEETLPPLKNKINTMEDHQNKAALQKEYNKLEKEYKYLQKIHPKVYRKIERNTHNAVITTHFNAWQYEDSKQIWAGLASCISERMEKIIPFIDRFITPFIYAWKKRKPDLLFKFIVPIAVAVCLVFASFFGIDTITSKTITEKITTTTEAGSIEELETSKAETTVTKEVTEQPGPFPEWLQLMPYGSILFTICFLAWRFAVVILPVSRRVLEYIKLPDYRDQMGFQHQVLTDLRLMYDRLIKWKKNPKIVVFIDDLDRCSEDKIMEILQAINLILGENRFYVILGIDTEMLHRAITSYYTKNSKGTELPDNFPENYLYKIIQLSFHLPVFKEDARFSFIEKLFSKKVQSEYTMSRQTEEKELKKSEGRTVSPVFYKGKKTDNNLYYNLDLLRTPEKQILEEEEDTLTELETYNVYKKYLDENPRELKRFMNIHRLVKIMLQQNRPDLPWDDLKQRTLIKWLLFCKKWPGLIDDIIEYTEKVDDDLDCIDLFADSIKEKDEKLSEQLKEFAALNEKEDKITAGEVKSGGVFHLAAYFCQHIKEESLLQKSTKSNSNRRAWSDYFS